MKPVYIIGIVIIALAIGTILTTLSSSSTYADFNEADAHPSSEFHVVGKFIKDKPFFYNPEVNPNQFEFYMIDNKAVSKKIILHKPKPQDFERSEQIVIIGKSSNGGVFEANDILMKCPSKYNDGKPQEQPVKQ